MTDIIASPAPVETTPQAAPAPAPAAPAARGGNFVWGTGRRKKSVARVRIRAGTGKFLVNDRDVNEFFKLPADQRTAHQPLETAQVAGKWDIWVNVNGGGTTGQAGAVSLGLTRALMRAVPETVPALRDGGLTTRDARSKERKKYGRRGARRGLQWAKR